MGGYLLEDLCSKGMKIRCLARDLSKVDKLPAQPGIEWVEGDILDVLSLEKAMEGCKQVIHSAAIVSFWKKRRDELHLVNVRGTENVVNIALQSGIEKLVHISSVAALGRTKINPVVNEETPWVDGPDNSWYGVSKHLAELEVWRGVEEGLPAVIVNPGMIMGKGNAGNWNQGTPKMVKMLAAGTGFYTKGQTGFVSAKDISKAVSVLMESKFENGERFILVSDNIPYKKMFEWIAEGLGRKAPTIAAPPLLTKTFGWMNERLSAITGKEPLITKESARLTSKSYTFLGDKISRETGFSYSDLKSEMKEIAGEWIKQNVRK